MTGRDRGIRYLRLRADTLMGMFRHLPGPARAQAQVSDPRIAPGHDTFSAAHCRSVFLSVFATEVFGSASRMRMRDGTL